MSKRRAVLFGLNYKHAPEARLNGCINDVINMKEYLTSVGFVCSTYTDDTDLYSTSARGIIQRISELAQESFKSNLQTVWIHYSGHGSFIRDLNGDEKDGKDECLVPSDFKTVGLLPDDILNAVLSQFNPKTKVICIFDCCHSATIGDARFSWEGSAKFTIENLRCKIPGKLITISGCLDDQVSMDAFNVLKTQKFEGAMTSCLLLTLKESRIYHRNIFTVLDVLRRKLKERRFVQIPKLCSTFNLNSDRVLL
jgi:hypothetical protein